MNIEDTRLSDAAHDALADIDNLVKLFDLNRHLSRVVWMDQIGGFRVLWCLGHATNGGVRILTGEIAATPNEAVYCGLALLVSLSEDADLRSGWNELPPEATKIIRQQAYLLCKELNAVGLVTDPLEGLTQRDFEALETFFSA